ncbi:MAG TPA: glucose 1-dehydrogenase [Gammaproteobacteria bacterium]|nr:glucose 1-dehydrogenase [Gammaproteobacteria bacterium]
MYDFNDKVALITGGGAGIGRATALAFARAGARVAIGNRNVENGEETVALIKKAGGSALFQRCDVTVAAQVEALVARAVREYGSLDCAFNNAGVLSHLKMIPDEPEEDFDRVLAVNAKGVWLAMKYELREMQKRRSGAIVNNASAVGVVGTGRGAASYAASKHAVVGLTKAAALENARLGIRVNVVAPAVIDTDMGAGFASDLKITMEDFGRVHPVGRVGTADEVANAVLWLCSSDASFVTGHTLMIDGGMTAQ